MTKSLSGMSNEELWQLFPIQLEEHRDEWQQWFNEERALLNRLIGAENIERVSHIGSTSVPGLIAKPAIDILLEITPSYSTQKLIETLAQSGYIFSRQPLKPPPHMMFMKGYTASGFAEKVFHIHVRYKGDWDEPYFCEYLRRHKDVATEYAALKLSLKEQFEHNRDAYTEAKTEFVTRITRLTREEQNRQAKMNDDACAVGIIGGTDGPTTIFVSHEQNKEKLQQFRLLLEACKKAAKPVQRRKAGDELKAYLIHTFGAQEITPSERQLRSLKLGALIASRPGTLQVPKMPEESAPKEEWLKWAKQSHLEYAQAADRLPDDLLGFRYAFLRIPCGKATKTYYRIRKKENRMHLRSMQKRLLGKRADMDDITVDIELSTGYMTMGNSCLKLMNELVLWRGITQQDIDQETPEFLAYAAAMRDTGIIKTV